MNDKTKSPVSKTSTLRLSRETLKHLNMRTGLRTGVANSGTTVADPSPTPTLVTSVPPLPTVDCGPPGRTANGCIHASQ